MPLGLGGRCTTLAEELEKLLVEYAKLEVEERYFWYSIKDWQLQKDQKEVDMRGEEVDKAVVQAVSSNAVLRV